MRFDLLNRGYDIPDIGTERMPWDAFKAFVEWLPPVPETAFYRARYPESWNWSVNTELAALMLYALQGANWQRAGGEGPKPELITRPVDGGTKQEPPKDEGFLLDDIRGELERRRKALSSR